MLAGLLRRHFAATPGRGSLTSVWQCRHLGSAAIFNPLAQWLKNNQWHSQIRREILTGKSSVQKFKACFLRDV